LKELREKQKKPVAINRLLEGKMNRSI